MVSIIVFVIFLIIFALFLGSLPNIIRSYRLSKLANRFGLSFDNSMKKFYWITPEEYKRNIIKGELNGKTIEIYDYTKPYANSIFIPFGTTPHSYVISKRLTIATINDEQQTISGFLSGHAPISIIKKFLQTLKETV